MKNFLSIIIPAYKEEQFIEEVLINIIKAFEKNDFDLELIVVIDNVPNDKTLEIVKNLAECFSSIKIIEREGKQGIGTAIKIGIKEASKEIIMISPGDASEDPNDLVRVATKMSEGYDIVFGNRFISGVRHYRYPIRKYLANRLCNYAIRILFGIKSNDITNVIKAYKSEILKNMNLTSVGFEITAEMPIKAYLNGYRNFTEIPINHYVRDEKYSKFELRREGSRFFKVIVGCFLQRD